MTALASRLSIRSTPHLHCALCGRTGELLYTGLQDRLFDALGTWRFARCSDPRCGLIWMDPMPLAEDIGNAYHSYYTHDGPAAAGSESYLKRTYHAIKRSYLASHYGYCAESSRGIWSRLGWLLYLFPVRRGEVDDEVRHLCARPGGHLLDVGCGSGAWLLDMRDLGWQVTGLDFDANAVAVATARGLQVAHGSLEAQCYPDGSFDAITLNHVIEHVPDPFATLAECRRVLKPGGQLMVFSPNSDSFGHLLFKQAWRGLEPPRHLYLFCPSSMRGGLLRAGFSRLDIRTVNSGYLWQHSLRLWRGRTDVFGHLSPSLKAVSLLLTVVEQAMLVVRPDVGECLAVRATKS